MIYLSIRGISVVRYKSNNGKKIEYLINVNPYPSPFIYFIYLFIFLLALFLFIGYCCKSLFMGPVTKPSLLSILK